uniref:trypsin n=2 Tax=Drosophila melanogaster TaxID=7227 RepID=Q9VQ97_DROME|eukprot:NP_523456.1 serine protease 12 [Drosophila melanogaster]
MLLHWLVLVASVTLISAGSSPERIVGGHPVLISEVPWQAALMYSEKYICGAVIYSDKIIITAAHCVERPFDTLYSVRVGSVWKNLGGQHARVAVIRKHEDYVSSTILFNDIAVIRLVDTLIFNAEVRPIQLADSAPAAGTEASVSGWGEIGILWLQPTSLLKTSVKILDPNVCKRSYQYITKTMICAAALLKDSCHGDSGGPLVSGGQLVGIVSYGIGCANPFFPGVYANVAELKPWILNAIEQL